MDSKKIIKYMGDAIPLGPHPKPHSEWVQIRLDVVQNAIDHLQAVLDKARTHDEQQAADTAARDWLISIGSEPS